MAINIKKSRRGTLKRKTNQRTKQGKIPVKVLRKMKKSKNPKTRKKANFALNARKWGKRR